MYYNTTNSSNQIYITYYNKGCGTGVALAGPLFKGG